jgi:hypothetical protein
MDACAEFSFRGRHGFWTVCLLIGILWLGGCHKLQPSKTLPLSQAGMDISSIGQLRQLGVSSSEVADLVSVRQSGIPDDSCVQLVRIAHERHQLFTDAQSIAGLIGAGFQQDSVLELARLNQLGLWAGEAEALRLSGLSDQFVLAVARRRASGEPVLSSAKITALKNAGLSESQILADVNNGISDEQADKIITAKNTAAAGFIRERRRHR